MVLNNSLSLKFQIFINHILKHNKGKFGPYEITNEDSDLISIEGVLHDAGKIFWPKQILDGGEKLTDEQYENFVKPHPVLGARHIKRELKKIGYTLPELCILNMESHLLLKQYNSLLK